jgi:hypothetical protein
MKRLSLSLLAVPSLLLAALWIMPSGAQAGTSIEGYPYFAKLLGGKNTDAAYDCEFRDMAVTDDGHVIVVGYTRGGAFTVTNDIRFIKGSHSGNNSAIILCMAPSGEWEWGVSLGNDSVSGVNNEAYGVAVEGAHVYVGGKFRERLYYSRLTPTDSNEELTALVDTHDNSALHEDQYAGFLVKINLADGTFAAAMEIENVGGSNSTTIVRDVVALRDSVYVCGDMSGGESDGKAKWTICNVQFGYYGGSLDDGFFSARIANDLTSCSWVVFGEDRGSTGTQRSGVSDGTARGIAVDDAGDAYVCGAIGGGNDWGSQTAQINLSKAGTLRTNLYGDIKTGADSNNYWKGTQSWFLLKVPYDAANASAGDFILNYDVNNWDNDNIENTEPYSIGNCVVLAGGYVYVGGEYNGFLQDAKKDNPSDTRIPDIYSHPSNMDYPPKNRDGFIIRFDTNLVPDAALEIGTSAQTASGGSTRWPDAVLSLVADTSAERLYAFGHYGGPESQFKIPGEASVYMSTIGDQDAFAAAINVESKTGGVNMSWEWVQSTATLDSYLPPPTARLDASGIDFSRGRIYCMGTYNPTGDTNDDGDDDRPLKLGTEAKLTTLNVTRVNNGDDVSFITAVDSSGEYFEQVELEIVCPLAEAQDEISPGVGTFRYFKDSLVTVVAPAAIYQKSGAEYVAENIEDQPADVGSYERRFVCTGYTIGDGVQSDEGTRYATALPADSKIKFNWQSQFRLKIENVVVAPDDHGLQDAELAALGYPEPPVGVNWIKEGTAVGPQVYGVGGFGLAGAEGLRLRYGLTRYVGSGAAPPSRNVTPVVQLLQFGDGDYGDFIMDAAAEITYEWTRQYEVRVRVAKPSGAEMPLVYVTDGSGQDHSAGPGDFWYHHGTTLRTGSQLSNDDTGLQLTGWELASTSVFPVSRFVPGEDGHLSTHLEETDIGGVTYMFLEGTVTLTEPFQVTWDYDDIIYYVNAALGQQLDRDFFNSAAVNDANGPVADAVGDWIDFAKAPVVHQSDDESGAQMADHDMHAYDSVGKRSWLLQPGVAVLEWTCEPGRGPSDTLFTKVHTGFPGGSSEDRSNVVYYKGTPEVLTEAAPNQYGAVIIDQPQDQQSGILTGFEATFDIRMSGAPENSGWRASRGTSFSYGGGIVSDWAGSTSGTGDGLRVQFYQWEDRIALVYGSLEVLSVPTTDFGWANKAAWYQDANEWMPASIEVSTDGFVTVLIDGRIVCDAFELDVWDPQAGWRFAFGAQTHNTDDYMKQEIREVLITAADTTHASGSVLFADGTEHELTPPQNSQYGSIIIDKPAPFDTQPVTDFRTTFDFRMTDKSGAAADGISFSYGGEISDSWAGGETGTGNGLRVHFDSYGSEGLRIYLDGDRLAIVSMDVYAHATEDWASATIAVSGKRLTVIASGTYDGEAWEEKVCERLAVDEWAPQSDWRFAIGGRTGGSYSRQTVRDIRIEAVGGDLIPDYFGNPAESGDVYPVPETDPRRKHIADTPSVQLDVSSTDGYFLLTDSFYFRPDIGASGSQVGALTPSGDFDSEMPGWSVLLFSKSTIDGLAADGDLTREELFTRVIRTEKLYAGEQSPTWWDDSGSGLLRHGGSAEIGANVGSEYDTAGLGTGYLMTSIDHSPRYMTGLIPPDVWLNYNPAIYNAQTLSGPIVPVNIKYHGNPLSRSLMPRDDLVVVWYTDDPDYADADTSIQWPYQPVCYRRFHWPDQAPTAGNPTTRRRIVIASRLGSAGKDEAGNEQFDFDPERYSDVMIYNQPIRGDGFNPNEEHALIAPSFADLDSATPPPAAYALRNDLNVDADSTDDAYTSEPYVLVQYFDIEAGQHGMAAYAVQASDGSTTDDRLPEGNRKYTFEYPMEAGQIVVAPYPLNLVIGATPINNTRNATDGSGLANPDYPDGTAYEDVDPQQRTWFVDHKGTGWAVSGNGRLRARYYYPFRTDFWLDTDLDGEEDGIMAGDSVCWLPEGGPDDNVPVSVEYPTEWPEYAPILKAGETLTYSGGEYRADHPDAPGLPGAIGWSAGQIVYDDLNPEMEPLGRNEADTDWTLRIISPLEQRRVSLDPLPSTFAPAGGRVRVVGAEYQFVELSASLQGRVFYDSLTKELGIRGFVNDRTLGDSDLTAAPPAVYVLEPNVLTAAEKDELRDLASMNYDWRNAVEELQALCLNPEALSIGSGANFVPGSFLVGLQKHADNEGTEFSDKADPFRGLGPGLAVIPNQGFLDPDNGELPDEAYVTFAENNDESLGDAPVSMHIIKVSRRNRYRGSVKTILPPNAFDEKVVLRHTGDFGTFTGDLVYQWFTREEDGTEQPLPATTSPDPWQFFSGGRGLFQVSLEGTGPVILRDNLVFCRYAHKNETNSETEPKPVDETTDWTGTEWDTYFDDHTYTVDGTDYTALGEWAGAGNSPTVDGDFLPQLVMGWVKRVLDAINPYEARVSDFNNIESPATYTSMIQQAGARYEGQVALNTDKDVIENHGLIELYTTVLERAKDLSIDLSQPDNSPGVVSAILLAATRIAQFYTILGNEAWCDAMDPTIGIGNGSVDYSNVATGLFSFQNQLPNLLDEELALLRGGDMSFARPVYNRLFWNFTKEQGEAAYATNYDITDANLDGFIDEDDAMKLFPQGHGDAWGHYLSALRVHYDLLNHRFFNWHARSELYNLMDIVIPVDYFDERHFAETAAAKARTGTQVCRLTYRDKYVDDPEGQWQGYADADSDRAWGLDGWTRRAGQGAYFDWLTANAITPPEGADADAEGIELIDRGTVPEISEISENLTAVQQVFDDAGDGVNPLGVHADAVPIDIDPAKIWRSDRVWDTHFSQVCSRAVQALDNARVAFNHANRQTQRLRKIANSAAHALEEAEKQDLAFRNRLIEVFGTPYPEHIGAGKPYPAGYDGPDILLYMYVDRVKIERLTSGTKESLTYGFDTKIENLLGDLMEDPEDNYTCSHDARHAGDGDEEVIAQDLPKKYELQKLRLVSELKEFWEDIYNQSYDNGPWLPFEAFHDDIDDLTLPVTATDYAYQADASWGQRASVGKLQRLISDLVIADVDFTFATWEYVGKIKDINYSWASLKAELEYQAEALETKEKLMGMQLARDAIVLALNQTQLFLGAAEKIQGLYLDAITAAVEGGEPDEVGMVGPFPIIAYNPDVAQTISWGVKATSGTIFTVLNKGIDFGKNMSGYLKTRDTLEFNHELTKLGLENSLRQKLLAFNRKLGTEHGGYLKAFQGHERFIQTANQYRTMLQQGLRIIEERGNWNRKLARRTQQDRYHDMALRLYRNEALEKYHDAFDLAAQYVYLAAKAYDYETNFAPDYPASAAGVLDEIVSARTLGAFEGGKPIIGVEGLGDCLARLKANYDVLRGQMGFDNPQVETGRFSLRGECFRIREKGWVDPDTGEEANVAWQNRLEDYRVDDLWDVWAFRHYCRPMAGHDPELPEPGLVIRFPTQVLSRYNFFGHRLGPGDHSYDPSHFATKIRSVGVWFTDYDNGALAETPRAYLVPAGADVMTIPTSGDLQVREWNIVHQRIPVPFALTDSNLEDPTFIPANDGLDGTFSDIVRFAGLRAYFDGGVLEPEELTYDSRLVGRSVWNTEWVLIIPASTMLFDAEEAVQRLIYGRLIDENDPGQGRDGNGISDIKLYFQTYAHSGG